METRVMSYKSGMSKIVERWLLFEYEGRELTPLSKPFKTRQEAEKSYTVGDHLLVTLSGGRIAKATVKAAVDTTGGFRLQVLFGDETGLNYLWQVV